MRIAFVTPEYPTEPASDGGLASYLEKMTVGLVAAGHDPVVLVASDRSETLSVNGVKIVRVQTFPRFRLLLKLANASFGFRLDFLHPWHFSSALLDRALGRLQEHAPVDVVQFASYTATSLAARSGVPRTVRVSGYQSLWEIAYGGQAESARVRQIERLELRAFRNGGAVFAPSRLLAGIVADRAAVPVEVIRTPMGQFACGEEDPRHRDALGGAPYLLFFGTIGRLKGVDLIAQRLEDLLGSYPSLRFVFAGKEAGLFGEKLIPLVRAWAGPHHDRVVFTGPVGRAALVPLIKGAKGVVLPSRIDNLPNACLESMALGQVVLGAEGASFEELIAHGQSGLLFRANDADDLRAKLDELLLLEPAERSRIGAAARRVANEHLDAVRHVATHIAHYQHLARASAEATHK
jgi:glycosyltransferase involved in cell wall biosynthesis